MGDYFRLNHAAMKIVATAIVGRIIQGLSSATDGDWVNVGVGEVVGRALVVLVGFGVDGGVIVVAGSCGTSEAMLDVSNGFISG